MQRLLAALITALLNGSLTARIEHNLNIIELAESIGELGNSIIGRRKKESIISSCLLSPPQVIRGLRAHLK